MKNKDLNALGLSVSCVPEEPGDPTVNSRAQRVNEKIHLKRRRSKARVAKQQRSYRLC